MCTTSCILPDSNILDQGGMFANEKQYSLLALFIIDEEIIVQYLLQVKVL